MRRTIYDASGRVELRELGWNGSSPTLKVDYDYFAWNTPNGQGRLPHSLRQIKAGTTTDATSLLDLRYFSGTNSPAYDAVGNLLNIYDYKMGSPQTQSLTYDSLDRLTSASVTGGSLGLYSENYTYDPDTGNLASKGGVSYYYEDPSHVHAVTRLSNGNTYGYDANGNMTQRTIGGASYTLEYDAENRLTTVKQGATTIAAFSYDGDGARVTGTVNGATTAYVGEILEWTGSTSTMVKYYYAGSNRVAMRVGSNNPKWLLSDHLGSQSVVASYNGLTKEGELRYKAWGEIRHTSGTTPTKRQYTGQVNEDLIKLYWIGSRWYDPELGRWIQPDVIVPEAVQGVQAWDRYAYVNNSPVNFNDPSGHCLILCTALIGGAVGAIVGAVGYTAYTVATGNEFNTGHMLLAAGGGAATGALIGTGVGIAAGMSTAATTTTAVTGAVGATTASTAVLNATGGDPTDEINAASQAFGNLSQAANYGIQQGNQLKNAISGTGLQVHHLIEQRLAPALGQGAAEARQWLSVAVTPEEHQVFTNAWRNAIGYINSSNPTNTATTTANNVWTAAQDIYAKYPALLDAVRQTLFGPQ